MEEIEDDDPTEELQILTGHMMDPDTDTQVAEPISAANQAFENENLDAELRDANDRVLELSSELQSRSETMRSIHQELHRLREFSEFLEKEVESGKGVISDVTDELISVRTQQNDASEQLRRREHQIAALGDKLAKKEAFIENLARRVDNAEHADAPEHAARQNGHAQLSRLRMLVARHDNKMTRHPVLPGGISVGTSPENDLQLADAFVSYRHAKITETAAGCVLKDLDSSNGTWINERRIKWQVLRDGDLVDIGPLRFEFIDKSVDIEDAQIVDEADE
ncbi:MAG: FHA domain-containing protein [Gammaproteobacteria bacterium]|nr:FHA domain-containing protein [Gammaproteobacteria bacterium]